MGHYDYYFEKNRSAFRESESIINFINLRLAKLKELEDRLKVLEDKIVTEKAKIKRSELRRPDK